MTTVKYYRKVYNKALFLVSNNIFINWLLIFLGKDDFPILYFHFNSWASRKYREDKTVQENVGCSHVPFIQNLVDDAHLTFARFVSANLKKGDSVLDVGCGPGLFLQDLKGMNLDLYGVDLNAGFLEKAKELIPSATLLQGNFFDNFKTGKKFNLLSSFSVLMYIQPSRIEEFFDRMYDLLDENGFVFIQYAHAVTPWDLFYPDLTYIRYSPARLGKIAEKKFKIIKHQHFYYSHAVKNYDAKRYFFPDGRRKRLDTIENSFVLILQKKN